MCRGLFVESTLQIQHQGIPADACACVTPLSLAPMGKLDIKEAKKAQIDAASRDYIVQPRLGELMHRYKCQHRHT